MSTDIVFRSGEFQIFRANTKFHFGPLERNIEEGELIEFDGTTMLYEGEKYSMPKLRGPIKAGWLVPKDAEVGEYKPQPAGIEVRPADELKARDEGRTGKHSMGMVGHEETVVVSRIGTDSGAQIGSGNRIADERPSQRSASVVSGGTLGSQGGKTVGTIGSASGAAVGAEGETSGRASMTVTASSLGRLKSDQRQREEQFGKRQVVSSTPSGVDVADVLEAEDPEIAARLRERRAAAKASEAKVGGHPNDKKQPTPTAGDEDSELTSLWDGDPSEAPSDPPKAKLRPRGATESEKEEAANFEWDTSIHWTKRVKKAVEFAENPRILRKILAQETPSVASKIEEKLEALGL